MTERDIYAALTAIFETVFARGGIVLTPLTEAQDIKGWDSFRQIDIIMACEAAYGFQFSNAEIDGLRNVGDLAAVIMRHRA